MSEDVSSASPDAAPSGPDAGDSAADPLAGLLVRGLGAAARARRLEKYGTEDEAEVGRLVRAEWSRPRRILYASVLPLTVGGVLAGLGAHLTGSSLGGVAGFVLGAVPLGWFTIARALDEHAQEARHAARVGEKAQEREAQMAWLEKRRKRRR